jgi:hypothetical protein
VGEQSVGTAIAVYAEAILKPDNKWRKISLERRYHRLLSVIDRYIYEERRCPFCKRQFKTALAVRAHLKRGSNCTIAFRGLIMAIKQKVPQEQLVRLIEPYSENT